MAFDYRVSVIPAMEVTEKEFTQEFHTIDEAVAAKNSMAYMLLFLQDKIKVMKDYSNIFTIEKRDADGWFEVDEYDFL